MLIQTQGVPRAKRLLKGFDYMAIQFSFLLTLILKKLYQIVRRTFHSLKELGLYGESKKHRDTSK